MTLSLTLRAETSNCSIKEREACKKALKAADELIFNQDNLITKLRDSNQQYRDENEALSKALVEMKEVSDNSVQKNMAIGAAGFAAGLLTILFIKK